MFKIVVLDDREGIRLGLKHLLGRYELIYTGDEEEAEKAINDNNIDLIVINFIHDEGLYSGWDFVKKWADKKKIIVIAERFTFKLAQDLQKRGALACIDKMDLYKLPELVDRFLNQAHTKIIEVMDNK